MRIPFYVADIEILYLTLKHCRACVWKIRYEGVCREANTAQGEAKCCICFETPPVLYFSYIQARRCFKCYIVLPGCLAPSVFL